MDRAIKKIIEQVGGVRSLARLLDINHSAILRWEHVPADRILEIEQKTGIPREEIRPELYRKR